MERDTLHKLLDETLQELHVARIYARFGDNDVELVEKRLVDIQDQITLEKANSFDVAHGVTTQGESLARSPQQAAGRIDTWNHKRK